MFVVKGQCTCWIVTMLCFKCLNSPFPHEGDKESMLKTHSWMGSVNGLLMHTCDDCLSAQEMVLDKDNGGAVRPRYLIYDIIQFEVCVCACACVYLCQLPLCPHTHTGQY